ncbi:MAG: TorD/DmsD family molecular chaperone [Christensenellales bacterium]|jgi:TorA maturation chaperone TorD
MEQDAHSAKTRRDIYALIANLLLKRPEAKGFPVLAEELAVLLSAFGESREGLDSLMARHEFVKNTEQEYYDVFFVPKSGHYVPPYVSSLMSYTPGKKKPFGLLDPVQSSRIQAIYDSFGFNPHNLEIFSPWRQVGAADHIGFCFALMANLCEAENLEKNSEIAETWRTSQTRFLKEELLPCLPNFEMALSQAKAPFYSTLGRAAHLWACYDITASTDIAEQ